MQKSLLLLAALAVATSTLAQTVAPAPLAVPMTPPPGAAPAPGLSEEALHSLSRRCEAESFHALHMARNYLLGGRNRDHVLPYVDKTSKEDVALAEELFKRADAGEVRHHAPFAAEKFATCAERSGLTLAQPQPFTARCLAHLDVPFFLYAGKERGLDRAAAIGETEFRLKDRVLYPATLIQAAADQVYRSRTFDEVQGGMSRQFWSCMGSYQPEPPAAQQAAPQRPATPAKDKPAS